MSIITSSHSTITKTAEEVIKIVANIPSVTKISSGIIKKVGGGRRSIKITPVPAGLKVAVRGSGAVQELVIFTKEQEVVEKEILCYFQTI